MPALQVDGGLAARLIHSCRRIRAVLACALGVGVGLAIGASIADVVGPDLVGWPGSYGVGRGDTLADISRDFTLGYVELRAANPGIDAWQPAEGSEITLPTRHVLPQAPRRGIVINLADMRLYYFPDDGGPTQTFPIGIGHGVDQTPTGVTSVTRKREDPIWIPPPSLRAADPGLPTAVGPGPDNPLGAFALSLGWPNYAIHGTNRPYGIGRQVSHGCIRLYPDHIAELFAQVSVGTPVTVVDQPVKVGWFGGELYLEVHPIQSEAEAVESGRPFAREPIPGLVPIVLRAAGDEAGRLDWPKIRQVEDDRRGVPVQVSRPR